MRQRDEAGRSGLLLLNAFSLGMLGGAAACTLRVRRLQLDEARRLARGASSAVGHASTAAVFSRVLGTPVAYDRITVTLQPGDRALVGQYVGPRLPEGATELPEGARIVWYLVESHAASEEAP